MWSVIIDVKFVNLDFTVFVWLYSTYLLEQKW